MSIARPTATLFRPGTVAPIITVSAAPAIMPPDLTAAVNQARERNHLGQSSVTLRVSGGDTVSLDGMQALYAASTVKLPIYLTLAYRVEAGEAGFTWDTPVTVRQEDVVGGTGVLQDIVGQTFAMREIARVMIAESDNTAANLILGYLGGGHNAEWSAVRHGARDVASDMENRLGVSGIVMQHGLEDTAGMAMGLTNRVTTDALVALLRRTIEGRGTLAGANELYTLLVGRGMHNPWHPGETVTCNLHLLRIGGIYPADGMKNGVRLDLLYVDGPGQRAYFLAVGAVTTPAIEPVIEARIAHFEGDVQQLLSDAHTWAQCVDDQVRP